MELETYTPAILAIICGFAFCGLFVFLAKAFGPRHVTSVKDEPFECGSVPIGSPRGRYSVKFYQVAILFLVFDIEAAFMYPWALMYKDLSRAVGGGVSMFGFVEMLLFVVILVVALTYVWRKKAIGWD